jgi:dihydrofolate synthase/folylpolyglutamate synthase
MRRPTARFESLTAWLEWQETLHPSAIDLGLERVGRVADRIGCRRPAACVISVAGTNGKGSSIALLEAVLLHAGYRVGCYTSPHLHRYNERVRIQGEAVSDQSLCEAFALVDQARGCDTLTYFEFGTLAAFDILRRARLDVAVMEVGMGGRLDAVNILDADAALITSIGIDHTQWLGPDRESIGREKAGILRAGKPAVCGDRDPPASLIQSAGECATRLHILGADFDFGTDGRRWDWRGEHLTYRDLPRPRLAGAHQLANAASVLMVLELLQDRVAIDRQAIVDGLFMTQLPGRIETITGKVEQVLDVSHNAQAAGALFDTLARRTTRGATYAVIGMMADKDVEGFARVLDPAITHWYAAGLAVPRASAPEALAQRIAASVGADRVSSHRNLAQASEAVWSRVQSGDRVVVCGSFYTVAEWTSLNSAFE